MDIVLIDDHTVIRQLMAQVIDTLPAFRIVGEASDYATGRELCLRRRPEMIVLDLALGGASGIELLQDLRRAHLESKCLVFSGNISPVVVQRAYALGVTGFAEKGGTLDELIEALEAVAAGRYFLGHQISEAIRRADSQPPYAPQSEALTAREKEVLRYIAQGMSNKAMASTLGVSVHTVENHRANLIRKTGIQPPAKLALLAIQLGLIEPSSSPFS
jgi:DNA-binding NarL/FixJ family response regulator